MTAEINDDDRVAGMTFYLGQLLQYSVFKNNQMGTVASELEHLEKYLHLQNIRFNNKFHLSVKLPKVIIRFRC